MNRIVKILIPLFIAWTILHPCFSYAGKNKDPELESKVNGWMKNTRQGIRFLENKGQMVDLHHQPVNELLFKAGSSGVDMYITTWGLSYVFTKADKVEIPVLGRQQQFPGRPGSENEYRATQYCRADMVLLGADIRKENIIKENESDDRADYYLSHCPEGILNVHSYGKITIKNIYPGIDWVLYSTKEALQKTAGSGDQKNSRPAGIKYDFIVHPGADLNQIKFMYKWADRPGLQRDGSLKTSTPLGDITEDAPVSFSGDKQEKVTTGYNLNNNVISFNLQKYNKGNILVIDPALVWATYYAGSSDLNAMVTDGNNVWATGAVSENDFPASPAGGTAYYQGTYDGGSLDLFLLEFNTCGVLIWASYYGGSDNDQAYGLDSDGNSVWITGYTKSIDFPTKFPVGSYSQSAPGAAGAFNIIVLQFNCATNARVWATCYGGSGGSPAGDFGYSISSDGKNVWITGIVTSTDFPTKIPPGAYNQPTQGGGPGAYTNAFILEFNTSGALIWSTYFGGSESTTAPFGDWGRAINSDGTNVWVTGYAVSSDFPTLFPAGSFQQPALGAPGAADAFISKFSASSGKLIWSTYYGGSIPAGGFTSDHGNAINSDGTNVWVAGCSNSPDFPLQNLPGAYNQTNWSGAFVLQFSCATCSRNWATYFGGSGTNFFGGDVAYSIQSNNGNVWVCGGTVSSDFPTVSSACAGYNQGPGTIGFEDVFIAQFNTSGALNWSTCYGSDIEDDWSGVSSDGTSIYVAGDYNGPASGYQTQSYGGAYFDASNTGPETMVIGKFDIACAVATTLTVSPGTAVCPGSSTQLMVSGGSGYSWSPSVGLTAANISNPVATPASTTTYTVTGTLGSGCLGGTTATATVLVTVNTSPEINPAPPAQLTCASGSVVLNGSSTTAGVSYQWLDGGPNTATDTVTIPGTYTLEVADGAGCTAEQTYTVSSNTTPPVVSAVAGNNLSCAETSTMLTATSSAGVNLFWNGGSLVNAANPATISAPGTYTVTASDPSNGCSSVTTVAVSSTAPGVSIQSTTNTCIGEYDGAISILASGTGLTYSWSNGSANTTTISGLAAGVYSVTVKDINNCTATAVDTVKGLPDPVITAGTSQTIVKGTKVTLTASGGTGYLWTPSASLNNPSSNTPVADPDQTTTYTVIVTGADHCNDTAYVTLTVEDPEPCDSLNFFIPSAFSPNDDGKNDVLYFHAGTNDCITNFSLKIYNRWGEQVFESTNPENGWDGTYKGKLMDPSVFVYYLNLSINNSQSFNKKGNVTLLR